MMRLLCSAALVAVFSLTLFADQAWVGSRDLSTVHVFDTVTDAEIPGSPVTVGTGPIDMASDKPDAEGPHRMFVANSGSNTVSVLGVAPIGGAATIDGTGTFSTFGTFFTPSGIARAAIGLGDPFIVVTDQKVTSGSTPTGRSTLRVIDPVTLQIVDDFREPSATARYNDVIWTWNSTTGGRLWIADDGDGGVVVVRVPDNPPFLLQKTLVYNGYGEFADFIYDSAATPAFLVAPRRLATNGTRVVVADGASSNVTILDANYAADTETSALVANVALPAGSGNAIDVEVVGNFAYVTSTGTPNFHRIDLTTNTLSPGVFIIPGTPSGLMSTSDLMKVYIGGGTGSVDLMSVSATSFPPPAPTLVPPFSTPRSFPFAFYSSVANASPPSTPVSGTPGDGSTTWISTGGLAPGEGGSSESNCGLLGAEVLLLLAAVRLRRRRS